MSSLDEEVLNDMAIERECSVDDIRKLVCDVVSCQEEQCLEYRRRLAIRSELRSSLGIKAARGHLPDDDKERLEYPMFDGLLAYFPAALAEVARVSKIGNDQHNPGQPLHWARSKSTDHENKILRHLVESGTKDSKGVRHSARLAWRALALLQVELEREEGAPLPRNAKY
jgi:hypothetical protein